MSWEAGVDLAGGTVDGLPMPNAMVHVARLVHTPVGSAPSGMIFWQPDPKGAPVVAGFVCPDRKIGAYYGPNLFKGTPFESAPVLEAKITITPSLPGSASSRVEVAGHVFEVTLSDLGAGEIIHRPAGSPMPFAQQGVEARAGKAVLKVDGKEVAVKIPAVGMSGGPGAVWAPCGIYAR